MSKRHGRLYISASSMRPESPGRLHITLTVDGVEVMSTYAAPLTDSAG
jgi:hypothetical protein